MSGLVSVDDALVLLGRNRLTLQTETVALDAASGRRLAAPLVARVTQPPAAISAMDGYAVRLADVRAPGAVLDVIGEAPAGLPFRGEVRVGAAVRIFTGAHIPEGADHVVIQEDAERRDGQVVCRKSYDASAFVRLAGIDFLEGETLISSGTVLTPVALSLVAASNHAELHVFKRPRIGLLANGDELRPPGSVLAEGQVVNANPASLSALVRAWGGEPVDLGIAGDSVDAILRRIQDTAIDLFLPVGGASVGDHDHMRAAFAIAGFEPVFEKIAVKPGKPTWLSRRNGQRVLGLPGNPASALVCAHLFLKPLLLDSFSLQILPAELAEPLPANDAREQFLRAVVQVSGQGRLVVKAASDQDSSLLKPFLSANGLIRRMPNAGAAPAGAVLPVVMIGAL